MTTKLYQVFISGSHSDLQEERSALLHTLLGMGCIPVGPELLPDFGDSSKDIWPHVQQQISASDYVIVLNASRYGPLTRSGVSYMHREYTYAKTLRKPILCLLHDGKHALGADRTEATMEGQARLRVFRDELKAHPEIKWGSVAGLKQAIQRHLPTFIEDNPSPGWVRPENASFSLRQENLQLRQQVAELNDLRDTLSPSGSNSLEDSLSERAEFSFICNLYIEGNCKLATLKASISWKDVFAAFSSQLKPSASEDKIKQDLSAYLANAYRGLVSKRHPEAHAVNDFQFTEHSMRMIRLQLRRLGFIKKDTQLSDKNRAIWQLTAAGERARGRFIAA
ncbi:DUF4062 domain-containing protein [Aestuariirhabdus sp. Z084]|uniref:DUF4062 domain-containing protein n=1 Tax=Aestuariirhabdus haliotis TaxID=2918751 RepID=UPI00201B3FF3|nr:DUF4062 domain-containing protein [Aestuariirhabdus haliotis]MCL6415178.1 DUF4062 domain-containing protein [Aestuariirhabdus haliotis]MCL6420053.1 DUF4062 domain-containing protein [Aestuariirhabdus haliotis]